MQLFELTFKVTIVTSPIISTECTTPIIFPSSSFTRLKSSGRIPKTTLSKLFVNLIGILIPFALKKPFRRFPLNKFMDGNPTNSATNIVFGSS